ncbi:hypothetical protein ACHAXS_004477 [Conticribra weissflogii]
MKAILACFLCMSASLNDALVQPLSTIQPQPQGSSSSAIAASIIIGGRQTNLFRLQSAKSNSVDKNETQISSDIHGLADNSNEGQIRNFNKKKESENHFGTFGGMFQNMFSSQSDSTKRKGKFGLPEPKSYQHINEFDVDLANEIEDALSGLNYDYNVLQDDVLDRGGSTSSEVSLDSTCMPEGFPTESTLERSRKLYFADEDEPSWKIMDLSKTSPKESTQPKQTIATRDEYGDVGLLSKNNPDFGEDDAADAHLSSLYLNMQDQVDLAFDGIAHGPEVGMNESRMKITSVVGGKNKFGKSSKEEEAANENYEKHDILPGFGFERRTYNDGDSIIASTFLENLSDQNGSGDDNSLIRQERIFNTIDGDLHHDTIINEKRGDNPNDATSTDFSRLGSILIGHDDEYKTGNHDYDSKATVHEARGIRSDHFDSKSEDNHASKLFITPEALELALSLDLDIYDIYQDKMHYTTESLDESDYDNIAQGQSENGGIDEQDVQRYYDRLNELLLFASSSSGRRVTARASDDFFGSHKYRTSDSLVRQNDYERLGNEIYNQREEQKSRPPRKVSPRMESFRALREKESKFRHFNGDNGSGTISRDDQERPQRHRTFHDRTVLPSDGMNKFRKIEDVISPQLTLSRADFQRGIYDYPGFDPNTIKPRENFGHPIGDASTRISRPPLQGVDYSSHNSPSSLSLLASSLQDKSLNKLPYRIPSKPYASVPFRQISQESSRRPFQEEEDDHSLGVYGQLSALPHEYRTNQRYTGISLQPQRRMHTKGVEPYSEPGVYGQLSSFSQSRSNQSMYDNTPRPEASLGSFSAVPEELPNFTRFPLKNTLNSPIPDNSQAYCTEDALSLAELLRIRLSDVLPLNPDLPITVGDVERHLHMLEEMHQHPPQFQSMLRGKYFGEMHPFPPLPSASSFERDDINPSNRLADNTDDDVFPSFFSAAFQPQEPGESANEESSNYKIRPKSEWQDHDTEVLHSVISPSCDSIKGETKGQDLGTKLNDAEVFKTETANSKISHTAHKSDDTLIEDPKFYGIWND